MYTCLCVYQRVKHDNEQYISMYMLFKHSEQPKPAWRPLHCFALHLHALTP